MSTDARKTRPAIRIPVLAVDADSNSNLNEVLGVAVDGTLGNAREDMKKGNVPSGMTKDVLMSMKLEQAVVESESFDLVGLAEGVAPRQRATLRVRRSSGSVEEVPVLVRIDTPIEVEYFRAGGILPFVLRQLAA